MTIQNKKILLVGGGTGGHVTPLVAIIEKLLESGVSSSSIYFVTDKESAKMDYHCGDNDKLPEASGRGRRGHKPEAVYVQGHQIEVHTISSGKFNRFFSLSNIISPFKVIIGFIESLQLLRKIKPDVVMAKGAYLSAPLVYAASFLHIPIYLHESDSIMGASNERLSKYAQKIFVTFPPNFYQRSLKEKLIFSGLPIRKRFFQEQPADIGQDRKKIFIWGGSQGADRLNHLVIARLEDYLRNYELYHICGENNFAYCEEAKKSLNSELQGNYHLYSFLGREIEKVIASSDLVVSRAGATSLFELAAMGKATIVIPYPYSASNHQHKNAQYFKDHGAVILLEEENLDEDRLKKEIIALLKDDYKRDNLKRNIEQFASKEATNIIVNFLLK